MRATIVRRRWLLAAGLVVLAAAVVAAGAGVRRSRGVRHHDPELAVSVQSPAPGVVVIEATAKITHPFRDAVLFWRVELRQRTADGNLAVVRSVELDDLPHCPQTWRGVEARPRLAEQLEAVPAGEYNVYVEVREDAGVMDVFGNLEEASTAMVGESQWVTVR
jgi:hypothetical protein